MKEKKCFWIVEKNEILKVQIGQTDRTLIERIFYSWLLKKGQESSIPF